MQDGILHPGKSWHMTTISSILGWQSRLEHTGELTSYAPNGFVTNELDSGKESGTGC